MKVGVVGLGRWGRHLISEMRRSPNFEVVAATSRQPTQDVRIFLEQRNIALEKDLQAIVRRSDISGVVLATPHSLHEAHALEVLEHGKHVFVEKPVALTTTGAARIVVKAARHGLVLGVGHERRYEPAIRDAMDLLKEGALGKVLHIDANLSHDVFRGLPSSNWRLDPKESPGGLLTATGIHITDILVATIGPACSVSCLSESRIFLPPARDQALVNIQFHSGVRAIITMLSYPPYYGRITWFGDQGWMELKLGGVAESAQSTELTLCSGSVKQQTTTEFTSGNAVLKNLEAWASAIHAGTAYPITSDHVMQNAALLEAIAASESACGAWMDVQLPNIAGSRGDQLAAPLFIGGSCS